MTQQANPLKQYFRQIKMYIRLPTGTTYYNPGDINFTDNGEVGIMAMTGQDEITLKNPDALLNGEAMVDVIRSCVPAVRDPRVLLNNDVDTIITAIRHVTYGDKLDTTMKCPNCGHENTFKMDLGYALDNMEMLEPNYVVRLDSGLSIYIKPYSFPEIIKGLHAQFEQTKLARALEAENITDDQRSSIFKTAFNTMSLTTYELTCKSVVKIVDDAQGVHVTNQEHIGEFLKNTDRDVIDRIQDMIKAINRIGIKRDFDAHCESCGHTWSSELDFNPVNFS